MSEKKTGPRIVIVAALSAVRRAIGKDGKLLWHIPDDLARFKKLTRGHPVIMGRKTFESILYYLKKPLPNRPNIVVTRNPDYRHEGVVVVSSVEEALAYARSLDPSEIHIGGGAEIYAATLPCVDRLYLTLVEDEPEADTFFPDYSMFKNVIQEEGPFSHDGIAYRYVTLER